MPNYLTQKQFRAAKSRLTRAVNSGDPHKIIATVELQFEEWDDGGYAWPDDWHRWNIARNDAEMALRYAGRD